MPLNNLKLIKMEKVPLAELFLEAVISSGFELISLARTELVGALKKIKNVLANSIVLVIVNVKKL